MTFGERIRQLREELNLSQQAMGSMGVISQPGWIKLENGQRQASEKLIEKFLKMLVAEKYIKASQLVGLREELLILRYLGSTSAFVRDMAKTRAQQHPDSARLLTVSQAPKRQRGRPVKKK